MFADPGFGSVIDIQYFNYYWRGAERNINTSLRWDRNHWVPHAILKSTNLPYINNSTCIMCATCMCHMTHRLEVCRAGSHTFNPLELQSFSEKRSGDEDFYSFHDSQEKQKGSSLWICIWRAYFNWLREYYLTYFIILLTMVVIFDVCGLLFW